MFDLGVLPRLADTTCQGCQHGFTAYVGDAQKGPASVIQENCKNVQDGARPLASVEYYSYLWNVEQLVESFTGK